MEDGGMNQEDRIGEVHDRPESDRARMTDAELAADSRAASDGYTMDCFPRYRPAGASFGPNRTF